MHWIYSSNSFFSARLLCSDFGSFYGKKVWHSNDAYRKEIFQCNSNFKKGRSKCETLSLTEEEIKNAFIKAFNSTFDEKDIIIEDTITIKNLLSDTSEEDKIIEEANVEIDVVSELVNKLINSNSKIAQDQEKYQERYNELSARYEKAKKQLENASTAKATKRDKSIMIERFIESLKRIDGPLVNWSDTIWIATIDKAVIGTNYIEFEFKNGKKKKIDINH